jgi:hypothetical protein
MTINIYLPNVFSIYKRGTTISDSLKATSNCLVLLHQGQQNFHLKPQPVRKSFERDDRRICLSLHMVLDATF